MDYNFAKKLCDYLNIKLHKVNINTDDLDQKKELISALKKLDEPIANLNFLILFFNLKKLKRIIAKSYLLVMVLMKYLEVTKDTKNATWLTNLNF